MCFVFYWPRTGAKGSMAETERLLNGSNGPSYTSTINGSSIETIGTSTEVKKGGWVDYLIGFRLLFPYIW